MDVDKGKLDQYLVGGGDSKGSGMRMTYVAPGHPLMLIMSVNRAHACALVG